MFSSKLMTMQKKLASHEGSFTSKLNDRHTWPLCFREFSSAQALSGHQIDHHLERTLRQDIPGVLGVLGVSSLLKILGPTVALPSEAEASQGVVLAPERQLGFNGNGDDKASKPRRARGFLKVYGRANNESPRFRPYERRVRELHGDGTGNSSVYSNSEATITDPIVRVPRARTVVDDGIEVTSRRMEALHLDLELRLGF